MVGTTRSGIQTAESRTYPRWSGPKETEMPDDVRRLTVSEMLTELRFWAQVTGDARRTIICPPDLESRIKGWLSARGLLGFHAVEVHEYMPDGRIFVVDQGAINAYMAQAMNRPIRINGA